VFLKRSITPRAPHALLHAFSTLDPADRLLAARELVAQRS
jgi:hypothetical protein